MMNLMAINQWWDALSPAHQVFWFIAIVFSVLFLIQFVLLIIGLDTDSPEGLDHGLDLENAEHEFSALSLRSIIAFFTFFGWTGVLALHNQLSILVAVGMASAVGLTAMFLVAYLIFKFAQLEQSGTININDALDQAGEVYLPVPGFQNGQGKIHIKIGGAIREMDAVTQGDGLKTGTQVKVVEILDQNVLRVEVLETLEPSTISKRLT